MNADLSTIRAVVKGIGHGTPDRILTNQELSTFVDTNDEWIRQRTGIAERRVCADDETVVDLCTRAGLEAMEAASINPEEVDAVICGSVTGPWPSPSVAAMAQPGLGTKRAFAFDIGAACAGFIYATSVADSMIRVGQIRTALVIGADALTKKVLWEDRNTSVLFGDAAGAVVLQAEGGGDRGVLGSVLFADGTGCGLIKIVPETREDPGRIHMAGSEVFRFAVQAMGDACVKVLADLNMTPDQIDLFVPHQANQRIIDAAAKRLGLPSEKVFLNVDKYGNTSGGSIPLALYEATQTGKLRPGMTVMTVGFGAGLVWGANVIRW